MVFLFCSHAQSAHSAHVAHDTKRPMTFRLTAADVNSANSCAPKVFIPREFISLFANEQYEHNKWLKKTRCPYSRKVRSPMQCLGIKNDCGNH